MKRDDGVRTWTAGGEGRIGWRGWSRWCGGLGALDGLDGMPIRMPVQEKKPNPNPNPNPNNDVRAHTYTTTHSSSTRVSSLVSGSQTHTEVLKSVTVTNSP